MGMGVVELGVDEGMDNSVEVTVVEVLVVEERVDEANTGEVVEGGGREQGLGG